VRAHGHGPAGGADRAGARRRRLGERTRRHSRRGQQVRGGDDPRGRAPLHHGGLAGRTRAAVHRGGRGRPAGRQALRSRAAAVRAEDVLAAVIDALQDGAAHAECDVDVTTEKQVTGYRQRPSLPAVAAAEAALRACGYEPRRIATGGASDANIFTAAGLPCVNVANGTQHNHEPTERVSVSALESMLDVTLALLDEAAAVG